MKRNTQQWLHGLLSGFIGGAASAGYSGIALMGLSPETFNLGPKLGHTLLTIAVLGALMGVQTALAYLKTSPLPPEDPQP